MLKSEGGTMATHYMLFKKDRNKVADTQWFVNNYVDRDFREEDLKWIEERYIEFEDDRSRGVYSEDGETFTFISIHRKEMPTDWIEVAPNKILGEI